MDQNLINQLRQKLDIVSVIGEYIPLTKKGRNYFSICPFHDDHNPSLSISSDKQIYKCFVCGKSGNVFNFVMDYEHITFNETIKILSSKVGMSDSFNIKLEVDKNNDLYKIMNIAVKFYQNNLFSKEGLLARKYLEERKLPLEIIKEFEIGLSLNKTNSLTNLLLDKKESLETLNLIDLSNTNHDTYINRIMFPIKDIKGNTVGFSGRIYDNSDLNKYQNTKETPLFKKREILFNYSRAKEYVRKSKSVIVMEGFMAVIRLYINEIYNCVATMGTAMSNEQALSLKKLSLNIILCYDGDDAGRKATITNGEMLLKMGINSKVIVLKDKLDPDDYILKYGKESFISLIENAINFTDYKIKNLKSNYNLDSISEKTNYINNVLIEISKETDSIKREIMLKNLASETDVWYNTLEKKLLELSDIKKDNISDLVVLKKPVKDKYLKTMERIIYYMLNSSEVITLIDNSNIYFPNKHVRLLVNEIIYYNNKYGNINEADFCTYLEEKQELQSVLKDILLAEYPINNDLKVVNDCLLVIKDYNIALEIKRLEKLIKEENDVLEQSKLMDQIRILKGKRESLC